MSTHLAAIPVALVLSAGLATVADPVRCGGQPTSSTDPRSAAPLLDALNACIQERFLDVDNGFGFRRLTSPGETPHRFKPENIRELAAVRDLERAGVKVVLYLTSRQVLQPKPETTRPGWWDRWLIKGPVAVAGFVDNPELLRAGPIGEVAPPPMDLWADAGRAMAAFERRESHDFTAGTWTFRARPVRAQNTTCLACHKANGAYTLPATGGNDALRVGDPLGVVLYGYKEKQ
jgi:hypothetical protein